MLKAVHVTTVHNRWDNRIYFKECHSLFQAGYQVFLIAPNDEKGKMDFVSYSSIPAFKSRFKRFFLGQIFALKKMLAIKGDIYHFHDPELLFLAFFMRMLGKRVVFDMHENVPFQIINKEWLNPLIKKMVIPLYRLIERLIFPFLFVIYAEKSYAKYYPYVKKSIDILNMPDLKMLDNYVSQLPFNKRERAICYVGGITVNRGIGTVIDALDVLNKNKPADECIKLFLIGALQDDTLKIKIESREWITYYGFLPASEAFKKIAECRLSVALLRDIPNYRGSYSTKIFEYMAVGVPCIYSDFEIYSELFGDAAAGWPLAPDNPAALAKLIGALVDDVEVLESESQKGMALAKSKLSWQVEAKKLEVFYAKVWGG